MFKIATVLAVVATFVCEAQAAVATPVQALKPRQTTAVCPLQGNEQFCGWYVDNVRLCKKKPRPKCPLFQNFQRGNVN